MINLFVGQYRPPTKGTSAAKNTDIVAIRITFLKRCRNIPTPPKSYYEIMPVNHYRFYLNTGDLMPDVAYKHWSINKINIIVIAIKHIFTLLTNTRILLSFTTIKLLGISKNLL
jgi:hypothetical protein